jgi:hypothetical protein
MWIVYDWLYDSDISVTLIWSFLIAVVLEANKTPVI